MHNQLNLETGNVVLLDNEVEVKIITISKRGLFSKVKLLNEKGKQSVDVMTHRLTKIIKNEIV